MSLRNLHEIGVSSYTALRLAIISQLEGNVKWVPGFGISVISHQSRWVY